MDNSEFLKKTAHYGIVLALVCAIAASALGFIFKKAKPEIIKKEQEQIQEDLKVLFPEENIVFEQKTSGDISDPAKYWEARQGNTLIAYVVIGEAKGYSSTIKLLVRTDIGIKTVVRIKVSASQETPGLGERIKETKSKNTIAGAIAGTNKKEEGLRPWFQELFDNLPVEKLIIVKSGGKDGVEAISGATISSNATVEAVKNGIEKLKKAIGDT